MLKAIGLFCDAVACAQIVVSVLKNFLKNLVKANAFYNGGGMPIVLRYMYT